MCFQRIFLIELKVIKIILFFTVALFATLVDAQSHHRWVQINPTAENNPTFIDKTTITKNSGWIYSQILINKQLVTIIQKVHVKCGQRKIGFGSWSALRESDNVILGNQTRNPTNFDDVIPTSVGEFAYDYLCKASSNER